jgi:hypothetical protein
MDQDREIRDAIRLSYSPKRWRSNITRNPILLKDVADLIIQSEYRGPLYGIPASARKRRPIIIKSTTPAEGLVQVAMIGPCPIGPHIGRDRHGSFWIYHRHRAILPYPIDVVPVEFLEPILNSRVRSG